MTMIHSELAGAFFISLHCLKVTQLQGYKVIRKSSLNVRQMNTVMVCLTVKSFFVLFC